MTARLGMTALGSRDPRYGRALALPLSARAPATLGLHLDLFERDPFSFELGPIDIQKMAPKTAVARD